MAKATWNNTVIADSDNYHIVEGNIYFPPETVNRQYFRDSDKHTHCPWKGDASYYDLEVDGKVNPAAAWYYPETMPAAGHIRDHVAFWNGVEVTE